MEQIREDQALLPAQHPTGMLMTVDQAKAELAKLQEFVGSVMKEGTDYGTIPGTDKPTLLKPGAEKLCEVYGYAPQVVIDDAVEQWDADPPFFNYRVLARLVNKRTLCVVAEGVGSCNSRETKYRYRLDYWNGQGDPPADEGWQKKKRRTGGGSYWSRRVENKETAEVANTILKMAKKRALVDATLSATRSSQLFTQDMEDLSEGTANGSKNSGKAKPPAQAKAEKGDGSKDMTKCSKCPNLLTTGQATLSERKYGQPLCVACQENEQEAA